MKRPVMTLAQAVELVALNDEPGELSVRVVAGSLTVAMLADVYGVKPVTFARRVVAYRKQEVA
jgi:hypothetical protein